jgi:fatty-acyl-CoA synthase
VGLLELAAALAGVTLVMVDPALREAEATYVLRQSRASGVFLVDEHRGHPLARTPAAALPALPDLREVVRFAEWGGFCDSGSAAEPLRGDRPWARR